MCLEIIIVSGNLVIISPIASYFVPSQAEPCWPIAVHCLGAKAMGVALLRPSSWLQEASTPPPPASMSIFGQAESVSRILLFYWFLSCVVNSWISHPHACQIVKPWGVRWLGVRDHMHYSSFSFY